MRKGVLFSLIIGIVLYPQLALAAWWNPLSWFSNWQLFKQKTNQQESIIENTPQLKRMTREEFEKEYGVKPSNTKIQIKSSPTTKISQTTIKATPFIDKAGIERLEALKNKISRNNEIIINNTAPGLKEANSNTLGYQYTLLDLVNREIDRLKNGGVLQPETISEYENLEIRTIGLYNQQIDAFEASTQQILKQANSYAQQAEQANQLLREMASYMFSYNSTANNPIKYEQPAAMTKFENEWKEYSSKLDEVKQQLLKEYQAAGGFWTESQLESNARLKLKEMGIKPPVSPYGGYVDSSGGFTSIKCNSLGSGYDCYGSDGSRIQSHQIPGTNGFEINSW